MAAIAFCILLGTAIAAPPLVHAASSKYAAIVVDHKTGKVLFSRNADAPRYPASLTKVMTLYLVFERLEAGKLTLDTPLTVSANAAAEPPTKLGLKPGSTITVEQAILALVTQSANDVATAIAENLAGSESAFARLMTQRAHQIGMTHTTFRNAHGLPNSGQTTTARDLAKLGRAIQDRFPQYFHYFKTRSFTYKGRRYGNHNHLLGRIDGVDGIKTGYTRASGFNLLTSVSRDDRDIVAVVLGGRTSRSRDQHMAELINTYLPKASKGKRTAPPVVARITTTVIPQPAPERPAPSGLAYAATARTPAVAAIDSRVGEGDIDENADSLDQLVNASISDAPEIPASAARSARPAETIWMIQIGAVPTEIGAITLLEKAQSKAGKVLAGVAPYTEPTEVDGTILHRARFAGFESQKQAVEACKYLKRQDFACLALRD